jgi:hypothetical protein
LAGDGADTLYAICGNGSGRILPGDPSDARLAAHPGFGHSVLKLRLDRAAGQFVFVDWFTPHDIRHSNLFDIDLCAGPVLLPWGNLVGAWGKDRAYYIMDRDSLGKFTPGHNAIVQYAPGMTASQHPGLAEASRTGHIHCAPVVFDDPVRGPLSFRIHLMKPRFSAPSRQFSAKIQGFAGDRMGHRWGTRRVKRTAAV